MIPEIKVQVVYNRLKVHIQNVLHLHIDTTGGLHIHSWVDNNLYVIEYTSPTGRVKVEYESREVWEEVLKQIDNKLE